MKWGKTHNQRMNERDKVKWDSFMPRDWFAWYPVMVQDGRTVWLQKVMYRKTQVLGRTQYWEKRTNG